MLEPSSVDMVLYHADCSDGTGAAWAAFQRLGDRATYHAVSYSEPPPDVVGRKVAILDFAYSNSAMKELIELADDLVIIDHHKSAMVELHDISCAVFDMAHSGAILAWNYFHPGKEPPKFLKYIEDRDLWKWELPYSHEFAASFDMIPLSIEEYDRFVVDSEVDAAQERGAYILAYTRSVVSKIAKRAVHRKIQGHDVAVVNSSHWKSEIGMVLSQHADLSIVWDFDHATNKTHLSLRSSQSGEVDCSELAKRFGGGGHRTAAGIMLVGCGVDTIFDREPVDDLGQSKSSSEA